MKIIRLILNEYVYIYQTVVNLEIFADQYRKYAKSYGGK